MNRAGLHQVAIVHNHWIHYKDLLFRAMAAAGVDFVVLYTGDGSARRAQAATREPATYASLTLYRGAYEDAGGLGAAWRAWRALEQVRPAALIISGWCDGAAWGAWLWGRVHRVPMILWAESNVFDRPRHAGVEALKRFFVRPFRAAHVYGASNREYLLRLGMPDARIFTKRAVLDTDLFRPPAAAAAKPEHRTLLFVGRLIREKNLETLLEAMSRVRQGADRPRLVLRLVGYGPLEARLRALAARLGVEPFVWFAGGASQADLPAVYAAADALILPSVSETWGLVVNEAMCCGLPVLISRRCGCAADLVTGETGWIFDPEDVSDLAWQLEEFAATPRERLAGMGAAARRVAVEYSPGHCAAIVARSIGAVLEGCGRQTTLPCAVAR